MFIILLLGVRKVKNYIKDGKVGNYAERLKNIGVVNKRGDAPLYMGKKPNPAIPGGEIYTFDDVDVDFGIFNEAAVLRGLRNIFCGRPTGI